MRNKTRDCEGKHVYQVSCSRADERRTWKRKKTTNCDTMLTFVFPFFFRGVLVCSLNQHSDSFSVAFFPTIPCLIPCLELTNVHRSLLCFFKGLSLTRFQHAGLVTGTMTGHVVLPVAEGIKSKSELWRPQG